MLSIGHDMWTLTLEFKMTDKILSPEARRALAEAEARRSAAQPRTAPKEQGGPKGPEPTRYGDWEKKGLTSDF